MGACIEYAAHAAEDMTLRLRAELVTFVNKRFG